MIDEDQRIDRFIELHASGCFVMPNPWNAGSAVALAGMGFPALATTSSGAAWTMARSDNRLSLQQALDHFRIVTAAVDVPVNADFEGGFATQPEAVAANVRQAVTTGIAGLSIEDSTGEGADPLFEFDLAVARIRAAREAIDASGKAVVLTARSEGFVAGRPDIDETIRRLTAFAEAGADCLYAPGIRSVEDISAVVNSVAPKPVNLLIHAPFITVGDAAALGVRRISVGGALAKTAWSGFLDAAEEISRDGTFSHFEDLPDVDSLFQNG